MDIVIDTSALIAVVSDKPKIERLIHLTSGVELIAPQSVHWKFGNTLSAMLRRQRIDLSQATQAIGIYRKMPIRFVEVELEDTLEIASELGFHAYDAYLIRCATPPTHVRSKPGQGSEGNECETKRGGTMRSYTYSEARRKLDSLLDRAAEEGKVRTKRRDGRTFVVIPEEEEGSPLDVEGIDLGVTTEEIVEISQEEIRRDHE